MNKNITKSLFLIFFVITLVVPIHLHMVLECQVTVSTLELLPIHTFLFMFSEMTWTGCCVLALQALELFGLVQVLVLGEVILR